MNEPTHRTDGDLIGGDASTELSANRTSLSFERTLMSADRTLMSMVRTSLSLIGFGFTIYQVFGKASPILRDADVTGRRLGLALLVMGIAMLVLGIASHVKFGHELTRRRAALYGRHLLHSARTYKATPTLLIAMALLLTALVALASITLRIV